MPIGFTGYSAEVQVVLTDTVTILISLTTLLRHVTTPPATTLYPTAVHVATITRAAPATVATSSKTMIWILTTKTVPHAVRTSMAVSSAVQPPCVPFARISIF
jgi:hypothetical protein